MLSSGARPCIAQDPVRLEKPTESHRPDMPSARHDPPGDIWLGAIFIGSLGAASIEQLDELDEVVDPSPAGRHKLYRSIPRTVGRTEVGALLAGATFVGGRIIGSEGMARVGVRSLETILAASAITTVLKVGFGRARPDSGLEGGEFRPAAFGTERWSFPSGHTANAFSLAATISREFGDDAGWVPFVAYPAAGLVGVSRLLDKKHWLTDVLAGAAVGIFASHLVGRLHPAAGPGEPVEAGITPLISVGDGLLLGLSIPIS